MCLKVLNQQTLKKLGVQTQDNSLYIPDGTQGNEVNKKKFPRKSERERTVLISSFLKNSSITIHHTSTQFKKHDSIEEKPQTFTKPSSTANDLF